MDNYENDLWPLIYDQFYQSEHREEIGFYRQMVSECKGNILELGCGTGLVLLDLLDKDFDIYGLDISEEMLEVLYSKCELKRQIEVRKRVSHQNMVDFQYDAPFEMIIIPGRSFSYLTTQEEQIRCLRNIHHHLKDRGKCVLNFSTPNLERLLHPQEAARQYYQIFKLPNMQHEIKLTFEQQNNIPDQIQQLTWSFKIGTLHRQTRMQLRWTFKEEFQLLLQLAGFTKWKLYGGFNKKTYTGKEEMVWIIQK
jgi:cyclopropane fatty-acyl-phospholipid synthase-like methyltransferase